MTKVFVEQPLALPGSAITSNIVLVLLSAHDERVNVSRMRLKKTLLTNLDISRWKLVLYSMNRIWYQCDRKYIKFPNLDWKDSSKWHFPSSILNCNVVLLIIIGVFHLIRTFNYTAWNWGLRIDLISRTIKIVDFYQTKANVKLDKVAPLAIATTHAN